MILPAFLIATVVVVQPVAQSEVPQSVIVNGSEKLKAWNACMKLKADQFSVLSETPEKIADAAITACSKERSDFADAFDEAILPDDPRKLGGISKPEKLRIAIDAFEKVQKQAAVAEVFEIRSKAVMAKRADLVKKQGVR